MKDKLKILNGAIFLLGLLFIGLSVWLGWVMFKIAITCGIASFTLRIIISALEENETL